MKYFIDNNIWFQGVRQPARKVLLEIVVPNKDGLTAICYDTDGDQYQLLLTDIRDDHPTEKGEDVNVEEEMFQLETGYRKLKEIYRECGVILNELKKYKNEKGGEG